MEKTIALLKPDAVERKLIGRILGIIEDHWYDETNPISAIALLSPSRWDPALFYSWQHQGKPYYNDLVHFMKSGPSVAILLEGPGVIERWRFIMGPYKDPDRSTIRGAFMTPNCQPFENLVHGSDSETSFAWEYNSIRYFVKEASVG